MTRVLLFAAVRDAFGVGAIELDVATVADAQRELTGRCPAAAGILARSRFAVNAQFVDSAYRLREGDEIAVIPPVSGG